MGMTTVSAARALAIGHKMELPLAFGRIGMRTNAAENQLNIQFTAGIYPIQIIPDNRTHRQIILNTGSAAGAAKTGRPFTYTIPVGTTICSVSLSASVTPSLYKLVDTTKLP